MKLPINQQPDESVIYADVIGPPAGDVATGIVGGWTSASSDSGSSAGGVERGVGAVGKSLEAVIDVA